MYKNSRITPLWSQKVSAMLTVYLVAITVALAAVVSGHEFSDTDESLLYRVQDRKTVYINNDDPSKITTIVGCDHERNTNQPDRTVDSTMTCEELLSKAREIAKGQTACYHELGGNPPSTTFTGCQYEGQVVYVEKQGPGFAKRQMPHGCSSSVQSGYDIKSIYIEEIIGNWRVVASNGIPNHPYDQKTPNTPCETYRVMVTKTGLPAPTADPVTTPMGAIGIAKSGAFLFNYLSAEPVCRVAAIGESQSFGSCRGHAQMNGFWHYHSPSTCLTEKAADVKEPGDTDPCLTIGWTVDGYRVRDSCPKKVPCFKVKPSVKYNCTVKETNRQGSVIRTVPIYPGCDSADYEFDSSLTGCTLDAANGKLETDGYTYYLSDSATNFKKGFPYIIPAWHYGGSEGYMCASLV